MYKIIIRPLFFLFSPEFIHHFVSFCLKAIFIIPGLKSLARKTFVIKSKNLEREVFGLKFPNPVGFAAGFDKKADLYNHLSNFGFSHIEIGTVTPLPQPGNPKPRLFRLKKDKALINRMGFNNPGLEKFVKNLRKNKPNIIIGGNIGKNTLTPNEKAVDDYCKCYESLYDFVDYFVVNVSCPNITDLKKLADKDSLLQILSAIQNLNSQKLKPRPLLLKISPDLNESQLDDTLEVIRVAKFDGIIATNTTTTRNNLQTSNEKVQKIGNGGLSGKPLYDRSNQVISYLHKKTNGNLPIIGVGGINSAEDAINKLKAGATLVQVYTGFIYDGPFLAKRINKKILRDLR
ncbi:MAG: quinone-dependent dihydroorotate dehydrogenase [Bacteroidetes bacterium]|nr:quinone-dependent dihydroorotate dehydrogenase [Bacteroidota bacterium]